MRVDTKAKAQIRADQINHFNAELSTLEDEGVLTLASDVKSRLASHHKTLLSALADKFDIDANTQSKQLTLGMRIASFLGSLAIAASLFFLFYQYWGWFSSITQTIILILVPTLSLGICHLAKKRDSSGYFAKIAALVTVASFVLNLSMLGQIYNITPSHTALLVWAITSFMLAYYVYSRLLLIFSIMFFAAFLSAEMGSWSGIYWVHFGERPEHFIVPSILLFTAGHAAQRHFDTFPQILRLFGLLYLLTPVLVLANWGAISYLPLSNHSIETIYQGIGFGLSAACIWYGTRTGFNEVINTGTIFFTVLLFTKFYDWWWGWFPKYLFFMVIALSSILVLLIIKRIRHANVAASKGVSHD